MPLWKQINYCWHTAPSSAACVQFVGDHQSASKPHWQCRVAEPGWCSQVGQEWHLAGLQGILTFVVVCVLCTPAIKSFGFSASGLNRHFHMVLSIRHFIFSTPHIFLELHPHSSVVLRFLHSRNPQASASEKEKWRYMYHSISKDGQLSRTLALFNARGFTMMYFNHTSVTSVAFLLCARKVQGMLTIWIRV